MIKYSHRLWREFKKKVIASEYHSAYKISTKRDGLFTQKTRGKKRIVKTMGQVVGGGGGFCYVER